MNSPKLILGLAILFSIPILYVNCEPCEKTYDLQGTVKDEHNQPIQGAKIWLYKHRQEPQAVTNEFGFYSYKNSSFSGVENATLLVRADGFEDGYTEPYTKQEGTLCTVGHILTRNIILNK